MTDKGMAVITDFEIQRVRFVKNLAESVLRILKDKGAPVSGTICPEFDKSYVLLIDRDFARKETHYTWYKTH